MNLRTNCHPDTRTSRSVVSNPASKLSIFDIRVSWLLALSSRSQSSPLPLALPLLLPERLEPVSVAELERRVTGSADDESASSNANAATTAHVKSFIIEDS